MRAMFSGAKLINISAGGKYYSQGEEALLRRAIRKGIIVVVASGNHEKDLGKECDIYPACYNIRHKNFHVVASHNKLSNYGGPVTDVRNGNVPNSTQIGSSFSAAKLSAEIVGSWK